MTVCIAAISHPAGMNPNVVALTDSMLTAGDDIEYEPNQSKIYVFNGNVIGLISGDTADQFEICRRAHAALIESGQTAVHHVAAEYAKQLQVYKTKQAEIRYLRPLGLSLKRFRIEQSKMDRSLATDMHHSMLEYSLSCDTIICGIDNGSGHIYVVDGTGQTSCNDYVGFAAVGLGGNHAESHFMFSQFIPHEWPISEALLLSYSAKKRAETAPSVGKKTFLAVIFPNSPVYIANDAEPLMIALEAQYNDVQTECRKIETLGYNAIKTAMEQLGKEEKERQSQVSSPSQDTSNKSADTSQATNSTSKQPEKRRRKPT